MIDSCMRMQKQEDGTRQWISSSKKRLLRTRESSTVGCISSTVMLHAHTVPTKSGARYGRLNMEYIKKEVVLRAIRIASSLEEAYEMVERMEGKDG